MNLPPSFTCHKNHQLKLPPQRTTHETEFSRIQKNPNWVFVFWLFGFRITLELSGPRQRVRLNDLLCEPLLLTLDLCFDLFGTEPAEHHCPVCTVPTTDFWNQPKPAFEKSETHLEIQPPRRNRQNEVTTIFIYFKKHPLKLPPKRTTHKTKSSRILEPAKSGFAFGFWTSRFCITLELSGAA